MEWNQNKPATLGLQWAPVASGNVVLDGNTKIAAVSFDQSLAEATGACKLRIASAVAGGLYAVAVYDEENAVATGVGQVARAVPNEDVSGTGTANVPNGAWYKYPSGSPPVYTFLDEYPPVTDFTDAVVGISYTDPAQDITYYGRMNTASLSLTGKRILNVSLSLSVMATPGMSARYGLNLGGVDYGTTAVIGGGFYTPQMLSQSWFYNPSTKKPFTIADIVALDNTDEWYVQHLGTAGGYVLVNAAWLDVEYCDENRIAIGSLDHTSSVGTVPGWQSVTLTTPTGGTWTKQSSGRHLYTVRRINSVGSISLPWLEAADACPVASGWTPTLHPDGYVTAMGTATKRIMPVIQRTTVPADSFDSLPYAVLLRAQVSSGQNAEMEFSNATVQNYGVPRFLVNPTPTLAESSLPNALLTYELRRRSDSALMGTAFTLTLAEALALPDLGGGWRMVTGNLPTPGLLAAATQYFHKFSSATTGSYWSIMVLDTTSNTDGVIATFGGTTDKATINGAAEADRYDIVATIGSTPAALTGFTAVLGSQAINATVCGVATIARADLAWTASALGASYGSTLIERTEDGGATWLPIMRLTIEATNTWKDYEALRGIAVSYRISVVRNDGAVSPSTTAAGSVTKPNTTAPTLFLVSNYDPTYNVAYEYQPDKEWEFLEADEAVEVAAYLRDNQLGFLPLESRGTRSKYTITVGVADLTPAGGGRGVDAFAPLRAIAHAPLPYVCVLDFYGTRQLALLRVPAGRVNEPASRYLADFVAATVTDTPYATQ